MSDETAKKQQSLKHKVVLRIVSDSGSYLAELTCRGHSMKFAGKGEPSQAQGARSALAAALGALKAPCAIECFIQEECAIALADAGKLSIHNHQLRPYYLSPSDDPGMKALHNELGAKAPF
jgi:hypothetical protein